ncbi:MAG: MATE family efflux transporter, partial [Holdemanella sp.]|nr:MATE family efflux transporter [Holdemanella sp.]
MKSTDNYQRMTETPILKLVISLSIPTVISMLVTNIYNLADTAFVGQLGNSASGAVGIVFGFMSILQAIGFLFGQGGGSILSRKLGAKEDEAATKFASTAFFGALFVAIIVEIICFIFIDDLVRILGSTPTIMPYAKTYITYILLGSPFIVTSF